MVKPRQKRPCHLGALQGSGKDPYQTRVDLAEPAFKCSCPSRKFPCKHGIGLMLILAKDAAALKQGAEPGWVTDWLATRQEKAEKKVERTEAKAAAPVDLEAQAERHAQRESRVADGIEECKGWLEDLVRRGLAAAQTESDGFFERVAARMVDAQAPGLAGWIRRISACIRSGEGWQVRSLHEIGRLHLLLEAGAKLGGLGEGLGGGADPSALHPDLAGDVRTALGFTQSKEEALAAPPIADRWLVVGQIMEEEERLRIRRTWLIGRNTKRRALLLDFAAGAQPFESTAVAGTEFDGELAFFPSRTPLRALLKTPGAPTPASPIGAAGDDSIESRAPQHRRALAENPWLSRWPIALPDVALARSASGNLWSIVDAAGHAMPIRPGFSGLWKLISISGGRRVSIAGEWDGEFLLPLSILPAAASAPTAEAITTFEDIAPRWAA